MCTEEEQGAESASTAAALLVETAAPHARWISRALGARAHAVYVADARGCVRHAVAVGVPLSVDMPEPAPSTDGPRRLAVALRGADGTQVGTLGLLIRGDDGAWEVLLAHAAHVVERELACAQEGPRHRDELLAVAAHEIRSTVTALVYAARNLAHVARREPTEEVVGRLETLSRGLDELATLTGDLLDAARFGSDRDVAREDVDLADIAREVIDRLGHDSPGRPSISLLATRPVRGRWDRLRLGQVVANLVTNAIKYGDGKPIDIEVTASSRDACLVVRDRGIGFSAKESERLFRHFERLETGRHVAGHGLGLYIVRRIVDALGGEVDVASRPGEGSTFTVTLPLSR